MPKTVVVVFGKNGARILKGVSPILYRFRKDCLINPAIPPGVPPHKWFLVDGKISTSPPRTTLRRAASILRGKVMLTALGISALARIAVWYFMGL